ncbi:hypothetical protein O6H91_14G068600 [Diphasiastrum complanatum]|uniref:Uncharacterized protein n=1 Tax=Diphasiastrum complanatum TaxID=34168 RepID=A0ACC2BQQ8_DIPCM|nr:hypothetical protein O6H91_14G068600 [Diphasiastrum complanatum]
MLERGLLAKCTGFYKESLLIAKEAWRKRQLLCWNFCPMLLVVFTFVLFVIYNGGIVVGAKEAHKVSLHFAQLLYFGGLSALGLFPIHFSPGKVTLLFKYANRFQGRFIAGTIIFAFLFAFLAVHYSSIAHPYLLADNRHYPFYLWKNVIRAHWSAKYLLIPFYVYSWCSLLELLGRRHQSSWLLVLCLGTTAVLVPAPLIEFRYYTIPFLMMALHDFPEEYREKLVWFLIFVQFLLVNFITLYMFLFRPFTWSHEPGVQRFMW